MEQNAPAGQNAPAAQNTPPVVGGNKNTMMAVIAYILFFVPLLTGDAKKDSFVKYHTKQGLVLFLLAVLINIGQFSEYFKF